jgi:hypothetical protein
MPGRPNIQSATLNPSHTELTVLGSTDDDPFPVELFIFIEQEGSIARGGTGKGLVKPDTGWTITMDANGIQEGAANGLGVEIRDPFESTTWTQSLDIR